MFEYEIDQLLTLYGERIKRQTNFMSMVADPLWHALVVYGKMQQSPNTAEIVVNANNPDQPTIVAHYPRCHVFNRARDYFKKPVFTALEMYIRFTRVDFDTPEAPFSKLFGAIGEELGTTRIPSRDAFDVQQAQDPERHYHNKTGGWSQNGRDPSLVRMEKVRVWTDPQGWRHRDPRLPAVTIKKIVIIRKQGVREFQETAPYMPDQLVLNDIALFYHHGDLLDFNVRELGMTFLTLIDKPDLHTKMCLFTKDRLNIDPMMVHPFTNELTRMGAMQYYDSLIDRKG